VTAAQRAILEQMTRRQTAPQRLVRRAHVILLAAEGQANQTIAATLRVHRDMVSLWRGRWAAAADRLAAATAATLPEREMHALIQDILADAPRPGTPATFTAEHIVQIVALACTDPAESGRPVTHWTPRDLADEAIGRGIVPTISPQSVERFFKSGRSQATPEPLLAAYQRSGPGGVRGASRHDL
jgi:putative transposase